MRLSKVAKNLELKLALAVVVGLFAYWLVKRKGDPAKAALGVAATAAAVTPLI